MQPRRPKSYSWMIYLGVALLVGSLVNAVFEVQKASSASGYEDEVIAEDSQGFAPYLLPVEPTRTPFQPSPTQPGVENPEVEATAQSTPSGLPDAQTEKDLTGEDQTKTYIPDRIVIPAIKLDAPVVAADVRLIRIENVIYQQWKAPDEFAAGWHPTSAKLGEIGNTVMNGHHNVHGEVFRNLIDLESGDQIMVYSGTIPYLFVVTNKMILPELGQPLEVRLQNARWLQPSDDERLTLVTCWPPEGNLDRLIIVAKPAE